MLLRLLLLSIAAADIGGMTASPTSSASASTTTSGGNGGNGIVADLPHSKVCRSGKVHEGPAGTRDGGLDSGWQSLNEDSLEQILKLEALGEALKVSGEPRWFAAVER